MEKRHLFGMQIDALTMAQSVQRIHDWVRSSHVRCKYVVTPNVDHTVLWQKNARFRAAYDEADLVLADGFPLVVASKILGQQLPERVTGSDLVPALFSQANSASRLRVYLLGAAPGVADRAATVIQQRWPAVEVIGTYSPPMGFERDADENRKIVAGVNRLRPDVLILGLGAPKQECWIHQFRDRLQARVALCVGATIDFLAGERRRAPRWMQRLGLEWFYRMCSEPRRLVKRYALDAWIFPQLIFREWRTQRARTQ